MANTKEGHAYLYENMGVQIPLPNSQEGHAYTYENMGLGLIDYGATIVTISAAGWGISPRNSGVHTLYPSHAGSAYTYEYVTT